MDCQNCGAPMRLFRKQAYFFCEYCATFYFPDASVDGVRRLGIAPEGLLCPLCREPLHLASLDDRYQAYQCGNCHGLLLDRGSFGETVQSRRMWAARPPDPPQPLDRAELHRIVDCPSCGRRMSTHPYYGPGALVIDTCGHCNLIWLDYGELSRAVNAPGRDRGAALKRLVETVQESEEEDPRQRAREGRDQIHLLDLLDRWLS